MLKLLEKVFSKKNSSFYGSHSIKAIHLEVTDKCNASCPQCARNKNGGPENPNLPKLELSLEDVKTILPPDFISGLKRLYMCGNFGDPMMAKDTLEIFKYLREQNENITLSMNTNASARTKEWWSELALIYGEKGNVKFGIDGLKDTHHLYRKGTDFDRIIGNAKAFIEAGGHAIWEYIVFRHNEHQIEEARELANKIGFKEFRVKKTGRFFSNTKSKVRDSLPVLDEKENILYYLEMPTDEGLKNNSLGKEKSLVKKFGSMETYLDQTNINCKVVEEGSLYISSEGLVLPCCWTANQLYLWYQNVGSNPMWGIINANGGKDTIQGRKNSIIKIIKGDTFRAIKESWSCKSISDGKLKVCAKTCGDGFDQFRSQYE